jgi:hypothetical protein
LCVPQLMEQLAVERRRGDFFEALSVAEADDTDVKAEVSTGHFGHGFVIRRRDLSSQSMPPTWPLQLSAKVHVESIRADAEAENARQLAARLQAADALVGQLETRVRQVRQGGGW